MGCLLLLCKYFFLSFFSLVFFSHNIDGKGELFRVLKNYRQVSWWDSFTAWWLFKTCPPLFMFKVNFDKLKLWNNNTPFFLFLRKASSTGLGREGEGGGGEEKGRVPAHLPSRHQLLLLCVMVGFCMIAWMCCLFVTICLLFLKTAQHVSEIEANNCR